MGNTDSRRRHSTKITLLCIGDPVLDIVCADCPASLVSSLGFAVGGCDLIEEHALEGILRDELSSHALERIPGGSAANVAKCFARLAQRQKATTVQFVGTLGQDESGREYKKSMEATGVDMSHAAVHPSAANGACLCLVTTSGERTMRTALRASREHTLSNETIRLLRPTWTHFEGYYVYKAGILETMKALRASGSRISFDFASFDVIESHLGLFETILESRLIDVLFCNEEEAMTFAKRRKKNAWGGRSINSPERFAAAMAEMYGMIMVVSQGAKGCVAGAWDDAKHAVEIASSPADTVQVVDTIGAGDHFSAGFLYALLNDCPLQTACRCGCIAGGVAVEVSGAMVDEARMQRLATRLEAEFKS